MQQISSDLAAENTALNSTLSGLDEDAWKTVSGFKNWTVYDHCCHLCISEEMALLAVKDGTAFKKEMTKRQQTRAANNQQQPDWKNVLIPAYGDYSGTELLERWNNTSTQLQKALRPLSPSQRIPWHGPDMSARSFATARLMETWAHGQSICDSLGIHRKNTDRLKHICELGYRTFGWSHVIHELPIPETRVCLSLISPDRKTWGWGEADSDNSISGSAEDFCLVVTQCRNVADTNLQITGQVAQQWMNIAQCFAGGSATPPEPGKRKVENDNE
jgi:uncharacterized protein (TIGR03084 family)